MNMKMKQIKNAWIFAKRNITEMLRDPLVYVFCLAFPVVMLALFFLIGHFAQGVATFAAPSLIPGVVMFSFSFVMLMTALLLSSDRSSAFLIRLYAAPISSFSFVVGYAIPSFLLGIAQEIVCIFFGFLLSLITGGGYFSFGAAVLLALEMLPVLAIFLFFGIFFGCLFNEKTAPGLCSVGISACGILGGAWMPLDTMGGFETFCRFLPFYPSVYIGRAITGATKTMGEVYAFDRTAALGCIPVLLFLIAGIVLSVFAFGKKRKGR
jgi:ABC-2 type transport system permease protein